MAFERERKVGKKGRGRGRRLIKLERTTLQKSRLRRRELPPLPWSCQRPRTPNSTFFPYSIFQLTTRHSRSRNPTSRKNPHVLRHLELSPSSRTCSLPPCPPIHKSRLQGRSQSSDHLPSKAPRSVRARSQPLRIGPQEVPGANQHRCAGRRHLAQERRSGREEARFRCLRPQDSIDNGAGRQRLDKEEEGEDGEDGDDFVPESREGCSSNDFGIGEGGKI